MKLHILCETTSFLLLVYKNGKNKTTLFWRIVYHILPQHWFYKRRKRVFLPSFAPYFGFSLSLSATSPIPRHNTRPSHGLPLCLKWTEKQVLWAALEQLQNGRQSTLCFGVHLDNHRVVQLLLAFINTPSWGCGEKDEKNIEKTKKKKKKAERRKKKEREKEKKREKRTLWFYLEKKSALPPAKKTNLSPSLFWRC